MRNFYFENLDDLVNYLYFKLPQITPLKLQKSLYFLFAYYGAFYGKFGRNNAEVETETRYPQYLFNGVFEAWKYGPVIREVYSKNKGGNFVARDLAKDKYDPEVLQFLDELILQLNEASDFSLVERSHMDQVWKNSYIPGNNNIMENDDIINEYESYLINES